MDILYCKDEYENKWQNFIKLNSNSTFYHRIEWKQIIEKSFKHKTYYIFAKENNELKGVLPLIHLKSLLFGSMLCSMPFLNYGGIVAENSQVEEYLVKEAINLQKKTGSKYIELRHQQKSTLKLPFKDHKVSMLVNLDKDPNNLWNNFSSKHRNNIRKSFKNNLEFETGHINVLDEYYNIICRGWKSLGTPIYQKDFFKMILNSFKDDVEICLVRQNGKTIAAAFNGLYKDSVEGMWTFSLNEYKHLQPNYFLYWKMLENACERGYKKFHLGRSTVDSSAILYKKKWNAIPIQLYWEYVLNDGQDLPELNVDNPKYKFLINSWRKMPLWMTQRLGPIFAKNIP